jgi:hypothetical protein
MELKRIKFSISAEQEAGIRKLMNSMGVEGVCIDCFVKGYMIAESKMLDTVQELYSPILPNTILQ